MKKLSAVLAFALAFSAAVPVRADDAAPDAKLAALAQVLAGQVPEGGLFADVVASDAWKAHAAFFEKTWPGVRDTRFKTAAEWRDKEVVLPAEAARTLHYPFSGPDFLNAALFFPASETYVFYSLEPTGQLPDLDSMTPADRAALFEEIQHSLGDIFTRNYFITVKMSKEFRARHLKGNRPLFLIFMSLMGDKVLSLEDVTIAEDGGVVPRASRPDGVDGVKIVFKNPALERPQTLYYFSLDVSNPAFDKHPEFRLFLDKTTTGATLIKSASYLLQDSFFSHVRRAILDKTTFLLQDDSGMPYRLLPRKTWDVRLYGKYLGPKRDFKTGQQPDLEQAYKRLDLVRPLPFHFGYHWEEGRESCVQIAVRKPTAPAVLP
jgi:hypothetical protein